MIDIQAGMVSIDERDLFTLQPADVRMRITTIPQDCFFMPETARFNLDPSGALPDETIKLAIHRVGLWEKITCNSGLSADLKPSDWSAGERQLLALARALMVESPFLSWMLRAGMCALLTLFGAH
ncbi:hypothetical protein BBP40_009111 [Aspergillus hancockii]|nr:hypothetical protein BBP40_009111 [Aspergillus hancockii]